MNRLADREEDMDAKLREAAAPLIAKADQADRYEEVWGRGLRHDGRTVSISLGTCRKIRALLTSGDGR